MTTLSDCGLQGDWMQMYSGRRWFPRDPKPDQFTLEDLAVGLGCERRYGGQGRIELHYSVAEHCVIGAQYFVSIGNPKLAVAFLFHDAAEGLCKDIPRALKRALGKAYSDIEDANFDVIQKKYLGGLCAVMTDEEWAEVKGVDNRILVNEKEALMRHRLDWGAHFNLLEPLPARWFRPGFYTPSVAKDLWTSWVYEMADSFPQFINTQGE